MDPMLIDAAVQGHGPFRRGGWPVAGFAYCFGETSLKRVLRAGIKDTLYRRRAYNRLYNGSVRCFRDNSNPMFRSFARRRESWRPIEELSFSARSIDSASLSI